MINLPSEFLDRMKYILGNEYFNFIDSYEKISYRGIRVNTLKCSISKLKKIIGFKLERTNFSDLNFYIPQNIEALGKNPLHHAGAFYIQEPSASSAVTALNPSGHDKVLDLCAAPGGKSTQIAASLDSNGLLWSNEIVRKRANILISNIERMGIRNAVVSSIHPDILCSELEGYFDKVLVDAPCSGEGLFRKNPEAIKEWGYNHVIACSKRQISILNSASKAVKTGGILVYSTCTFSKEENEEVIEKFLRQNKNFELTEIESKFGRHAYNCENINLEKARRIYPMDKGEGHFVAKLRKIDGLDNCNSLCDYRIFKNAPKEAYKSYYDIFKTDPFGELVEISDKVFIVPKFLPDISKIPILRAGVLFGELKKSRVEPAHNVFMASKPNEIKNVIDLEINSENIKNFLRGEEIEVNSELQGYTGVSVESIMVGFGKASNARLKNKYPKGLRNIN